MLTNISSPRYTRNNSAIDVEASMPDGRRVTFTASSEDVTEHGPVIHQNALDGAYGTIAPYVEHPTLKVLLVTARQMRLELLMRGLLSEVGAAVKGVGAEMQIEWEYATVIERSNAFVAAMAQHFGMSDSDLDCIFEQAVLR